jgi:magnesium transporter
MITTLVYRDHKFHRQNPPVESLAALRQEPGIMLWIDLADPTPEETKLILEDLFGFHPLVIEDCVSDSPLPKLETYDDYLYFVMHAVDYSKTDKFTTTELDLILGKNFLVTFHRQPLKPVQAALDRCLRAGSAAVRGPDRFAHTLLDLMVDAYKPALDELRQELEDIEGASLANIEARELFPRVVALRKELAQLRQIVRPQREVAAELAQGKARLIRSVILPYLRDLSEDLAHIENQAISWADQLILSFRVYLNKSSHEANEGIRVLTALTALTIPPLLVGGWFGMNFKRMTSLSLPHGYLYATGLTLVALIGMICIMRKKRWI